MDPFFILLFVSIVIGGCLIYVLGYHYGVERTLADFRDDLRVIRGEDEAHGDYVDGWSRR